MTTPGSVPAATSATSRPPWRRREGLLARRGLAGLDRGDRPSAVQPVGEQVVDDVDLGVGQQRLVVGQDPADPVLLGEATGGDLVARGHGHHWRRGSRHAYQHGVR